MCIAIGFFVGVVVGFVLFWGQQFLSSAAEKTVREEMDQKRREQQKSS